VASFPSETVGYAGAAVDGAAVVGVGEDVDTGVLDDVVLGATEDVEGGTLDDEVEVLGATLDELLEVVGVTDAVLLPEVVVGTDPPEVVEPEPVDEPDAPEDAAEEHRSPACLFWLLEQELPDCWL
jgi:hypothetical protein